MSIEQAFLLPLRSGADGWRLPATLTAGARLCGSLALMSLLSSGISSKEISITGLDEDATAFGCDTTVCGCDAMALGCDVMAFGCDATAFSCNATIFGCNATVFGRNVTAFGCDASFAVGDEEGTPGGPGSLFEGYITSYQ
jgi:hypothetical protein